MYLKTIELIGFKSFPDRTLLDFTDGVTTIVGPNGSGKSNISDAIRWVLGETRVKSLRGGSMQDVIFSGTEKRKSLNFAEVSITIDNTDKSLNIDFSEVMITRRVYRSGDSEYLINKTVCRMKDISELFMDTGLGRDGYSIVGQGKIDEIISGKPADRRSFFEEAAGISKYRHKKEEAERKLSQTNDNLLRIMDIVNELEVRLPALSAASEKATKYLSLRGQLKNLEIAQWCKNITANRDNLGELTNSADRLAQEIEKANLDITALDEQSLSMSQERRDLDSKNESFLAKEKDMEYNISTYKNQIALYENEISRNNRDIERLLSEKGVDIERLERFETQISDRLHKIEELNIMKSGVLSEMKKFDSLTREISDIKLGISHLQNEFSAKREEKSNLTVTRNTLQGKIAYLSEMEKNYEGFGRSVKEIFSAHSGGDLSDITLYGTLSDIIKTDKKTALAYDAVLGATLQNIICHDENDAKEAIAYLKSNSLGRVTFLPMSKIDRRDYDFGGALKESGVLGKAVSLLKFEEKFYGIVSSLLGKTLIVDEYKNAVLISKKYGNSFRIVTLNGEVFNAGGSIVGGNILKNTGFMSKSAEIEGLKIEIAKIDKEIISIIENEVNLTRRIESENAKAATLSEGLGELNEKKANLSFVEQQLSSEKENHDIVLFEKNEYLKGFSEKEEEIAEIKEKNESLKEDISFKNEQIRGEEISLKNIREKLNEIRSTKENSENIFVELQDKQKSQRDIILKKEQEYGKLSSSLEKSRAIIDNLSENLWESYELTHSQAVELTKDMDDLSGGEKKRITELKGEIKALGDVSVSSIEEYTEVTERHTFLNGQKNDLLHAKTELEGLIFDILTIMRENFTEQFKLIDANFSEVFKELFGGGTAKLSLIDPEDVLESGIEIIVSPPGKKMENISLLSGGEKAFTAIALLFSVLKLKPLPFCVFDEIEAALDEVNVYKFAEYIKKYKNKTQFILVSHRRGTMENADILYGVTMQEKGISQLISLNMHQVSQIVGDV